MCVWGGGGGEVGRLVFGTLTFSALIFRAFLFMQLSLAIAHSELN